MLFWNTILRLKVCINIKIKMSLRALIEIVVHLESFRNIDLFYQGIYYVQVKLYSKKKRVFAE